MAENMYITLRISRTGASGEGQMASHISIDSKLSLLF